MMKIVVTIIYYAPKDGPLDTSISFSIFESNSNEWATGKNIIRLAGSQGPIQPGATTFEISVPSDNLTNLYISGSGSIESTTADSIFVVEPPGGHVLDEKAFELGPPWVSLAMLSSGAGLSGDLFIINGKDTQEGTCHPYLIGSWALNVPPIPAPQILNIEIK